MIRLLGFAVTAAVVLLTSVPALANPTRVANLFANGGPVVVVCAPATCDAAAEERLQAMGTQLHESTKARVLIAYVEPGVDSAMYTLAASDKGVAAKDLLVATNGKDWSVRSTAIPADQLAQLERELAGAVSVEAGVALVVKYAPSLQQADGAVASTVTPRPRASATTSSTKQPATVVPATSSETEDDGLPWIPIAVAVLASIGLLLWWRRRHM